MRKRKLEWYEHARKRNKEKDMKRIRKISVKGNRKKKEDTNISGCKPTIISDMQL